MTSLGDPVVQARNPLWADQEKARVFATLRVRVGRMSSFVKSCSDVLRDVYEAMFPLNSKLQGLGELLQFFKSSDKVHDLVREQLHAGARAALAFVHVAWPGVDLAEVANDPPRGRQEEMAPHYYAADGSAAVIADKVMEESDREAGRLPYIKEELEP